MAGRGGRPRAGTRSGKRTSTRPRWTPGPGTVSPVDRRTVKAHVGNPPTVSQPEREGEGPTISPVPRLIACARSVPCWLRAPWLSCEGVDAVLGLPSHPALGSKCSAEQEGSSNHGRPGFGPGSGQRAGSSAGQGGQILGTGTAGPGNAKRMAGRHRRQEEATDLRGPHRVAGWAAGTRGGWAPGPQAKAGQVGPGESGWLTAALGNTPAFPP